MTYDPVRLGLILDDDVNRPRLLVQLGRSQLFRCHLEPKRCLYQRRTRNTEGGFLRRDHGVTQTRKIGITRKTATRHY